MRDAFAVADEAGWRGQLEAEGYAVVTGLVGGAAAAEALGQMWGAVEALGSVRRARPDTWGQAMRWPPMLRGGEVPYLGHAPFLWRLRVAAAAFFARFYRVPVRGLASSFEGFCMMHGARNYQRGGDRVSHLRCDQGPHRRGLWSLQAALNLVDSGPGDGGVVVIPGSHLEHTRFFEASAVRAATRGDAYLLGEDEKAPYRDRARKVEAPAGALIVWDSRALHCTAVPTRPGALGASAAVCMVPAAEVSPGVRALRERAFHSRRSTGHHPGEGFRVLPPVPRGLADRGAFLKTLEGLNRGLEEDPTVTALRCGLLGPARPPTDPGLGAPGPGLSPR